MGGTLFYVNVTLKVATVYRSILNVYKLVFDQYAWRTGVEASAESCLIIVIAYVNASLSVSESNSIKQYQSDRQPTPRPKYGNIHSAPN